VGRIVAIKMLLQVAVRDIGQLTDLARGASAAAETTGRSEKKGLKGRSGEPLSPAPNEVNLGFHFERAW
jgi:hypothetical protein